MQRESNAGLRFYAVGTTNSAHNIDNCIMSEKKEFLTAKPGQGDEAHCDLPPEIA